MSFGANPPPFGTQQPQPNQNIGQPFATQQTINQPSLFNKPTQNTIGNQQLPQTNTLNLNKAVTPFGAAQPLFGATPTTSLFGNPVTQTPASLSFGNTSSPSKPNMGSSLFGTPAPPAAAGSALFGAAPSSFAGTNAPSLFGAATPAAAKSFSFAPNSNTAGIPVSSSVAPSFGTGVIAPVPASNTSGPTATITALTSTTTNQTPGPLQLKDLSKPPVALSTFKNKTIDEILIGFTNQLDEMNNKFHAQATKIQEWDNIIIENNNRIQTVYGHLTAAEKTAKEMESNLEGIETSHIQLSNILSEYEIQIQTLLANSQRYFVK
jgi:hypothetical protein